MPLKFRQGSPAYLKYTISGAVLKPTLPELRFARREFQSKSRIQSWTFQGYAVCLCQHGGKSEVSETGICTGYRKGLLAAPRTIQVAVKPPTRRSALRTRL